MLKETEKLMKEFYNIKPHVFELYKKALNGLNIMAEYDGRTPNIGFNYGFWKDKINLICAWNDCKKISSGIQFKICLK